MANGDAGPNGLAGNGVLVSGSAPGFLRHTLDKLGKGAGLHLLGFFATGLFALTLHLHDTLDPEKLGWGFFMVMAPVFGGAASKAVGEAKWKGSSNGSAVTPPSS